MESADLQGEKDAVAAPSTAAAGALPTDTDNTTEAVMEPRSFPFTFDGRTSTSICAPSGPNSCSGTGTGSSENTFVEPEYEGTLQGLTATLTWTATTPLTEEMYISALVVTSCGDGCYEWEGGDSLFASGVSPLTLEATGLDMDANQSLALHVGIVRHTPPLPDPLYAYYSLEQAFTLEGAVTALVSGTA